MFSEDAFTLAGLLCFCNSYSLVKAIAKSSSAYIIALTTDVVYHGMPNVYMCSMLQCSDLRWCVNHLIILWFVVCLVFEWSTEWSLMT